MATEATANSGRRWNVWTFAIAITFTFTFTLMFYVADVFALGSNADVDYIREAQTCSRVDLRPALEKVGFDLIRNRGARETNFSFAFAEMLGLEVGQPISARWLEHWIEDHDARSFGKLQSVTRAILAARLRPCLEDAVKSEDIESARLARLRLLSSARVDLNPSILQLFELFGTREFARTSFTPFACNESERTHGKPRAPLTLVESKTSEMIDRSLRAGRLPLVTIADGPSLFSIAARRLSVTSGRCEYLVRNYEGPTCSRPPCEDGSQWLERETFSGSIATVWSLEP